MFRFVHIGFAFSGVPKVLDLEPMFTSIGDWVRYSSTGWIVWTSMPLKDINSLMRSRIDLRDYFVASSVDGNQLAAFVPGWILQWIASKLPPDSFTISLDDRLQIPFDFASQATKPPPSDT